MNQNAEGPLRVAIQGIAGCYHDAAAREYFAGRNITAVEFESFPALFEAVHYDASLLGIVAIENTIAGSILPNHELLRQSDVRILGEHKMRISHVLAAIPGQTVEDITEVHSHPMALMQCEQFLHRHPHIRKVERFDTAGSAAEIAANGKPGHAAICGAYAAELYGLEILEREIETNRRNFTRFLVIGDPLVAGESHAAARGNKASLVFTLPHAGGALSKVLTILSFYDMNLSKIQSTPIIGREWEYRFYVDLTFEDPVRFHQAIDAVRPLMRHVQLLGQYKSYD